MDTTHQPPAGDPQDFWATQELGPVTGQPGQGPGWSQPPGAPGYRAARGAGPPAARPVRPAATARPGRLVGGRARAGRRAGRGGRRGHAAHGQRLPRAAGAHRAGRRAEHHAQLGLVARARPPRPPASGRRPRAAESAACASRAAKLKAAGFPGLAQAALRRCGHPLRRVRAAGRDPRSVHVRDRQRAAHPGLRARRDPARSPATTSWSRPRTAPAGPGCWRAAP